MKTFKGFSEGKTRLTPVPATVFRELLPDLDHLGEAKLIFYTFWRMDMLEGAFRFLKRKDYLEDERFLSGLAGTPEEAMQILDEAIERAVERGVLLRGVLPGSNVEEALYFLNTPKGRAAIQAIARGEWRETRQLQISPELMSEPPNIYALYEEHIGPLSPMIADALRDAEAAYPADWISEAIRIAVENNKRSWRYVAAILKRWQEEGRNDQKDRRDTEKARRRYAEW